MSVESATARQPPPGTATRNEQKWERIIRPKPQLHVPPTQIEFDPARPSSMFDGIRRHEHAFDGVRALERGKLTVAPLRRSTKVSGGVNGALPVGRAADRPAIGAIANLWRAGPVEDLGRVFAAMLGVAAKPAAAPRRNIASVSGGVNGALPVVRATDRHSNVSVRAVLKSVSAGGAQERFAYEVAAAVGMDHLLPRVGRRRDGTAAIELVRGKSFREAGITNAQTLEKALRHSWKVQFPEMPTTEVRRRARIDRQLVQLFDYLLANGDRHGSNGLFDARSGRLTLIDHGLINRYAASRGGLIPEVRMDFQGGDGVKQLKRQSTMRVEPEVLALVRGTDRARVEGAFKQMMRDVGGSTSIGSYATRPTPAFLDQVLARLDEVARTGLVRVR